MCFVTDLQSLVSFLRILFYLQEDSLERSERACLTLEGINISFKGSIDVIAESASVKRGLQSVMSWGRLARALRYTGYPEDKTCL